MICNICGVDYNDIDSAFCPHNDDLLGRVDNDRPNHPTHTKNSDPTFNIIAHAIIFHTIVNSCGINIESVVGQDHALDLTREIIEKLEDKNIL